MTYNFKRNTRLYLVYQGNKHPLRIYRDVSVSQRVQERSLPEKTLHNLNDLHAGAVIKFAEEGVFGFTVPLDSVSNILITLGNTFSNGTVNTFDLYAELDGLTYKLEKAFISRLTFNLTSQDLVTVSIQGSFSQKSLFESSIPGTLVPASSVDPSPIRTMEVLLDGAEVNYITSMSVEIAFEYKWLDHKTTHTTGISYPTEFIISSRVVSGGFSEYLLTENEADNSLSSNNSTLSIDIGGDAGRIIKFTLPSIVYTRRDNSEEVYSRSYDFRVNTNTGNAVSIIT